MTRRRFVAVVVMPVPSVESPEALRTAMVEDVCDLVAGLPLVEPALVVPRTESTSGLTGLVAPGTPTIQVNPGDVGRAAVEALGELGADEIVLLAGDAPDLPALLVGKLFRGLSSAPAAAIPAADGGLVAVGVQLPLADWLSGAAIDLDASDGFETLAAAAPTRRALSVAPGWHRVRTDADLARLDPGLEGWDATRTLLAAR